MPPPRLNVHNDEIKMLTVNELIALDDTAFERYVLSHLGPSGPAEIWEALTSTGLALRTSSVVSKKLADMNEQIKVRRHEMGIPTRAKVRGHSPDAAWHRKAATLLRLLEERGSLLAQVRRQAHIQGRRLLTRSERLGQYDAGCERPNMRGVSHVIATALLALDLDVVSRATIRALMPDISVYGNGGIGVRIGKAYVLLEKRGWIQRADDGLIRIIDQSGLLGHLSCGVDAVAEDTKALLRVVEASAQIARDLECGDESVETQEVRRRELIALKRLMEHVPANGERGAVRVVPRSRTL